MTCHRLSKVRGGKQGKTPPAEWLTLDTNSTFSFLDANRASYCLLPLWQCSLAPRFPNITWTTSALPLCTCGMPEISRLRGSLSLLSCSLWIPLPPRFYSCSSAFNLLTLWLHDTFICRLALAHLKFLPQACHWQLQKAFHIQCHINTSAFCRLHIAFAQNLKHFPAL